MLRRTGYILAASKKGGAAKPATGAEAAVSGATSKFKAELKKMFMMQLVLVPVGVLVLLWLYPPPSAEQDKKLREEYNKNAGWKT